MKNKILILLILISVFMTGCWDKREFEQTGFILIVGIDKSEDTANPLQITYTLPIIDERMQQEIETIPVNAGLLREAREKARRISAKTLEGGKIQQVIISKEIARMGGVHEYLEIFERDPFNYILPSVIISEGSAKEFLMASQRYKDKPRPSTYLNQLIEGNVRIGAMPDTKIFNYDKDYFIEGKDPVVPILKPKSEGIHLTGTALFREDKMVGEINPDETIILLALQNKVNNQTYILKSINGDGEFKRGIALATKLKKRKIDVKITDNKPVVDISLTFSANVDEVNFPYNLSDKAKQKEIQEISKKEIKDKCMKVLKYTQEVGSDTLGIGNIVRARHNNYWKENDWNKSYKEIAFNIKIKVGINNFGVLD